MLHSVLSLIPQNPKTILKDQDAKIRLLRLVEFFAGEIIATIHDFYLKKNLAMFDSHVGDTLCQIRAYRILLEVTNCSPSKVERVKKELEEFKVIHHRAKQCLNDFEVLKNNKRSKYSEILDCYEQIEEFLFKHGLLFKVAEDLLFLVKERFLTVFSNKNEFGISSTINYERMVVSLKISNTFSEKISHLYQKAISEESTKFVLNLLKNLATLKNLRLVLPLLQYTDSYKRIVLAGYEATKIIIENMLFHEQYLLIIVHRLCNGQIDQIQLLFKSNGDGDNFIFCEKKEEQSLNQPCLVVRGIVTYQFTEMIESKDNFIKRFLEVGVVNIVLANMANHPQYSAREFEDIANNPYPQFIANIQSEINSIEYLKTTFVNTRIRELEEVITAATELENELLTMQEIGQQYGCCIDNSSLFFIKHIFCDVIGNQQLSHKVFDKILSNKAKLVGTS